MGTWKAALTNRSADGLGDDRVGEERIPVRRRPVTGDDHAAAGALGDHLVEVVGLGQGELAHREVVADQERGSGPAPQPGRPAAVGVAAGEIGEQPAGLGEHDGVAAAAGELPEGLGEHSFAYPHRATVSYTHLTLPTI